MRLVWKIFIAAMLASVLHAQGVQLGNGVRVGGNGTGGGTPSDPQGSYQFNNNGVFGGNAHVLDVSGFDGVTWDAKVQACLNVLYATGGGTCDATSLTGSQTMAATLTVGNGSVPVKLILGNMGLTLASGAQLFYNNYATIIGQGKKATYLSASSTTQPAVLQAYGGTHDVHLEGFSIGASAGATAGIPAMEFSGPNPGIPAPGPTNSTELYTPYIGIAPRNGGPWSGQSAQFALYDHALTAAQVLHHAQVGFGTAGGYEAAVTADSPLLYMPLKETSGTTATDLIAGRNGTYTAMTLGTTPGIPGDKSCGGNVCTAPVSAGSGYVAGTAYAYLPGSDYTIEQWVNFSVPQDQWYGLMQLVGTPDDVGWVENVQNNGWQVPMDFNGVYADPGQPQIGFSIGSWHHLVTTYTKGNLTFYLDGGKVRTGTDVYDSSMENMAISGFDIGLMINSQGGCVCYNHWRDVDAGGAHIGVQISNSSGYAYGVNSNRWEGGKLWAPIGLWDSGSASNIFTKLDFEGNTSGDGKIQFVQQDWVTGGASGSGYAVGDTVKIDGWNNDAVLTITSVYGSGSVNGIALTNPGTGYGNWVSDSTTALTGSGTGLRVDFRTGAYIMGLSGGGETYVDMYEEAGAGDYWCGTGNKFSANFASNGATYSGYQLCSLGTGTYGGPLTNQFSGSGAAPFSLGAQQYIAMGTIAPFDTYIHERVGSFSAPQIYWAVNYPNQNILIDGVGLPSTASFIYGQWGHGFWNTGLLLPHGGTNATGRTSLGNPIGFGAPTLTAVGGTGTTYNYWVVAHDYMGGVAMQGPYSVSGPATLDGSHYIQFTFAPTDGVQCYDVLKGDTSHAVMPYGTSSGYVCGVYNFASGDYNYDRGQGTVPYNPPGFNTTGDVQFFGGADMGLNKGNGFYLPHSDGSGAANHLASFDSNGNLVDSGIDKGSLGLQLIAKGQMTIPSESIASGACQDNAAPVAGVLSTDVLNSSVSGRLSLIVGFNPSTSGGPSITPGMTDGQVHFDVCNWSASSVTTGAVIINWNVTR